MSRAPSVRAIAVVPVFDHELAVASVVDGIQAAGLDCVLVDDGSSSACAAVLDELARRPGVRLVRRAANGGKGAAVMDGLRSARAAGYTHALQVDADGQHCLADIARFIEAATLRPDAVICGLPAFDTSMPRSRYYLRYLTHVLVWLNTLSFSIRDSMCGFRVYPLESVLAMIDAKRPGSRMDFDIEVLVRLHWRGIPSVWCPTAVRYPTDGVSHFRLLRDNMLISRLHARLFLGMLRRLPTLCVRRLRGHAP